MKMILCKWRLEKHFAKIGDKSVIPALLETLKSREAHVRVNALKDLEMLGDTSVVPALIEALKDENVEVRWRAASIRGKLGDISAVPALIEALEKVLLSEDSARVLEINPKYAYACAGKGIALHQLGRRKEAAKCLRKALEIDPTLRENLNDLLADG